MIEIFDEMFTSLGTAQEERRRLVALRLMIETVRHTLATAPADPDEFELVIDELRELIVTYAERRIVHPPRGRSR
jgi:hypothetical protein